MLTYGVGKFVIVILRDGNVVLIPLPADITDHKPAQIPAIVAEQIQHELLGVVVLAHNALQLLEPRLIRQTTLANRATLLGLEPVLAVLRAEVHRGTTRRFRVRREWEVGIAHVRDALLEPVLAPTRSAVVHVPEPLVRINGSVVRLAALVRLGLVAEGDASAALAVVLVVAPGGAVLVLHSANVAAKPLSFQALVAAAARIGKTCAGLG